MSDICPQCGANLAPGEQCRERFQRCLAKDFQQPGSYGAVHHLIVLCYMLQHNAYSREGWLAARSMLEKALRQGIPPAVLRKQSRHLLDSGKRPWRLTKGAKLDQVEAIAWTRTIADMRLDTAEVYQADAREWADSVLDDTESLMQKF